MSAVKGTARYATDIVGGLVILAVIAGTGFSRYYWGYWLSLPDVGPTVRDHYPVFDFVYVCGVAEERCRLVRQNLYFEDVAGIEGFRWYSASLAALLIGGAAVSLWYS